MNLTIGIWALGAIVCYKVLPHILDMMDHVNNPRPKRDFYWWWTGEPCFSATRGNKRYVRVPKRREEIRK